MTDPTPEDRFRAYLADAATAGRMERPRPSPAERWLANAEVAWILAAILAVLVAATVLAFHVTK